jgi:hypothetical protein
LTPYNNDDDDGDNAIIILDNLWEESLEINENPVTSYSEYPFGDDAEFLELVKDM